MSTRIVERTSTFRLEETAARTVVFEAASNILIREVAEQGPRGLEGMPGLRGIPGLIGPPGPTGVTTLDEATDYNPSARQGGSVIEFDQASQTYIAGLPINTRKVHGGYF